MQSLELESELESDTSSINEGMTGSGGHHHMPMMVVNSGGTSNMPASREQLEKRIDSLLQENRVLKMEIETDRMRIKSLQEENKELRKASVSIQARAEQEEEYISNKLLKKIQSLKKEKETLANNYEREEEFLTNDLSRKLNQLRNEKVQLEQTLEQEQEQMVNKLMRKIEKLEAETSAKQSNLEQLRREKIELENTLEQEQESLVNRLWKRMERLEAEKRLLQEKLDTTANPGKLAATIGSSAVSTSMNIEQTTAIPPLIAPLGTSPAAGGNMMLAAQANAAQGAAPGASDQAASLTEHIINLRREVSRLKASLEKVERDHKENMAKLVREEKVVKDENVRLQRRLQMEVDRREALCRHLSESESSLEMDDERHFNESTRVRTISSPIPSYVVAPGTAASAVAAGNASISMIAGHPVIATTTASSAAAAIPNSSPFITGASSSQTLLTSQQLPATIVQVDRCPTCNQVLKTPLKVNATPSGGLPILSSSMTFKASSPPHQLQTSSSRPSSSSLLQQQTTPTQQQQQQQLANSSSLSSSSSSISSANRVPLFPPPATNSTSYNDSKK